MIRLHQLLLLPAAALLAACAQLGRDASDGARPEVRYYLIADT